MGKSGSQSEKNGAAGSVAGQAMGVVETRGMIAAIEAADAACKAADVKVVSMAKLDGGIVSITLRGDVASVQVAVEAAGGAARKVGELRGTHSIARPADAIEGIDLNLGSK